MGSETKPATKSTQKSVIKKSFVACVCDDDVKNGAINQRSNMKVIILGPAGCGKTRLTREFGRYLQRRDYSVRFVNLDPGCLVLPYRCDYDIRKEFTVSEIMKQDGLGPGGAMTRAMERLADIDIPRQEGDFVLIDTPGQLEVFAFHRSGPRIVEQFDDLVGIFILDGSIGVSDLPAVYLYSLATRYRLGIDTINIVNKVDLLEDTEVKRIEGYLLNPGIYKEQIKPMGVLSDIYLPVSELLQKIVPSQRIPHISAKSGRGFDELLCLLNVVKCACGDPT